MTMSLGEKATIECDAEYGYGAGGFPAWGIMPNSDLKFEIEVLSIN
jgi:peptidylprolyl isomerase